MSAAFALGCYHKEIPESIERLGHHLYRVVMRSKLELLNNTFVGVGFDWHIAADERPFEHLPFESFLAISVLRYEMFQHPKLDIVEVKGYVPQKMGANSYLVQTEHNDSYVGFLMDWKHLDTEEPVLGVGLQGGLSYYLLVWLCRFKEWEYEARIEKERIGVSHSGYRRGGEKLPFEP